MGRQAARPGRVWRVPLKAGYQAVKGADPRAWVVSAGLALTGDDTAAAEDDREYLDAMYRAGAAPYFDVLGAHPYGFGYPPDDLHGAHQGLNMARLAASARDHGRTWRPGQADMGYRNGLDGQRQRACGVAGRH